MSNELEEALKAWLEARARQKRAFNEYGSALSAMNAAEDRLVELINKKMKEQEEQAKTPPGPGIPARTFPSRG